MRSNLFVKFCKLAAVHKPNRKNVWNRSLTSYPILLLNKMVDWLEFPGSLTVPVINFVYELIKANIQEIYNQQVLRSLKCKILIFGYVWVIDSI